jgi:transcriptional regulator with XRE-family HTH domain
MQAATPTAPDLKRAREAAGLTLAEAAEQIGCSAESVAYLEALPLARRLRTGIAYLPRAAWLEQLPAMRAAEEARKVPMRREPELMPPAEVVERALRKVRPRIRPRVLLVMGRSRLLAERGGLPPESGDDLRPPWRRVQELRWRLDQLAEMIRWDPQMFDDVAAGRIPVHTAIMMMTQERGGYAGAFGHLRYRVDAWIQQRLDPNELV